MPIATFMQAEMAKQKSSTIEKERLRNELRTLFSENQIDIHVQNEREFIALWITRLEERGTPQPEIENRFEEITGQALELTETSFNILKAH